METRVEFFFGDEADDIGIPDFFSEMIFLPVVVYCYYAAVMKPGIFLCGFENRKHIEQRIGEIYYCDFRQFVFQILEGGIDFAEKYRFERTVRRTGFLDLFVYPIICAHNRKGIHIDF